MHHTHLSDTWGYRRPRLRRGSPCYWTRSGQKEGAASWETRKRWLIVTVVLDYETFLISHQRLIVEHLDVRLSWKRLNPLLAAFLTPQFQFGFTHESLGEQFIYIYYMQAENKILMMSMFISAVISAWLIYMKKLKCCYHKFQILVYLHVYPWFSSCIKVGFGVNIQSLIPFFSFLPDFPQQQQLFRPVQHDQQVVYQVLNWPLCHVLWRVTAKKVQYPVNKVGIFEICCEGIVW